jgi:hypothetical protein
MLEMKWISHMVFLYDCEIDILFSSLEKSQRKKSLNSRRLMIFTSLLDVAFFISPICV